MLCCGISRRRGHGEKNSGQSEGKPGGVSAAPRPSPAEASSKGTDKPDGRSQPLIRSDRQGVPVQPTPRDLWREALDKLDEQTRRELRIRDPEQESLQQQIDELVGVAAAKQKECDDKSWKFTVGGHVVVLRDQAASIIKCLAQIGDVAMQFAPPQASIVWPALKIAMQVRSPTLLDGPPV